MDGDSSDETCGLLKKNDKNIAYWESKPDRGIAHAWNKALLHTKGDWILFLGADDYLAQLTVFEKFNKRMTNHPIDDSRIAYGLLKQFTPAGDYLRTLGAHWSLLRRDFFSGTMKIPHPACFHHQSVFNDFGIFDEQFKIAFDYEFLLRILKNENAYFLGDIVITHMTFGGISSSLNSLLAVQNEAEHANRLHGFTPKYFKRLINIFIYKIILLLSKSGYARIAARILDFIRLLSGKDRLWTK